MPEYHRLTVEAVEPDTPDAVCVRFRVPEALRDTFRFEPGQYLTLRTAIDGETIERSYSICSGTDRGDLRVAIKRLPGGRFSSFANAHLRAGAELDVLPPAGRFTAALDPGAHHRYVALAAGSGITPILSIIRSVLFTEPESEVVLLYGNRSIDSIMFHEELDELKDRFMRRLRLHHFLTREDRGSELFSRRIDAETVRRLPALLGPLDAFDAFYVCGPSGMIGEVSTALVEAGVPPRKVKVERFQNPGQPIVERRTAPTPTASEPIRSTAAHVTVRYQGITRAFDLSPDASSILDGALEAGVEVPFSCLAGVCCTCRARLVEGEVDLARNHALEPWELEAGYTLTCQARPRTQKIVVDFDEA